jgi:hypothetical protein
VEIPQEYIVQKYYQYAGYPRFKKLLQTYEAGCPVCREGNSWGKKRRCYYILNKNIICCHNCGWYGSPVKWIQEVSGLTIGEILKEASSYDIIPVEIKDELQPSIKQVESLPTDSINLFDKSQISFFKDNKVVRKALDIIKNRRLDTAINRPGALYISLNDKVHKNRIILPFYDKNNNIIFYQSRAIFDSDLKFKPRYLSKVRGEKSLFNINQIDVDLNYIFIFEGPIDSFFIRNGVGVAGIQEDSSTSLSLFQERQLFEFNLLKKIWVLDSQWIDKASRKKTEKLISNDETVFLWPENYGKNYKDINELCIDLGKNEIDTPFILDNIASGIRAKLLLTKIK